MTMTPCDILSMTPCDILSKGCFSLCRLLSFLFSQRSNNSTPTTRIKESSSSIKHRVLTLSPFFKTEPFDNLGLHNVRCVGANSKVSFQVCSSFNSMVQSRKLPEILTFFKKTVDTLRSEATEYKSFVGICCVRTKPACQHFLQHQNSIALLYLC